MVIKHYQTNNHLLCSSDIGQSDARVWKCLHACLETLSCFQSTYKVGGEGLAPAVPKRIHKYLVVLDGHRAYSAAQVEGAPLEHDTVLVVDAGAFREDEEWCSVCSRHMSLHPLPHQLAIFHLQVES